MANKARDQQERLLGIVSRRPGDDADDRSSGHPMRRFAEFGILPGYEFPALPATLRLRGDVREEEPVSVERRFGLAQYQPEAPVHARGHRWRVVGLDTTSPWNPENSDPDWLYVVCDACKLRYDAQAEPACRRCKASNGFARSLRAYEFGGFLAVRDDRPILEEEDRIAVHSLLRSYPQWDGEMVAAYRLQTDWVMEMFAEEHVRWLNESKPPSAAAIKQGAPQLHEEAQGFYLCPDCGQNLLWIDDALDAKKPRKKPRQKDGQDPYKHAKDCTFRGQPPVPLAMTVCVPATTLKLLVDLPGDMEQVDFQKWGYTLGYALRAGMKHLYMLDGPEIEFDLEGLWEEVRDGRRFRRGSLTFIDGAVGGSGFLERAAAELHLVAQRALDHLQHDGCETACYRCLKTYQNQRYHELLVWPPIVMDLELLAAAAPTAIPVDPKRVHDPGPWLEAYDAGVGSPLELKFLRLFEAHGLKVDKQVEVAADTGGPILSISDFVLTGSRVAIYIDSATFHRGRRLRRDQSIRQRLREGTVGWKIVELRAADLGRGADVVREILVAVQ